jgi:7tm Chemosensory receptor
MTAFSIFSAMVLLFEETYNWGYTLDSLLNVIFAWLLTIMGLLLTSKMLLAVFAIRMILREINNKVQSLTITGIHNSNKLGYLVDVHASLCELLGETNRIFEPVLMCYHMMNFINLLTGSYFITLIAANLEKSFVGLGGVLLLGTCIWIIFSAACLIVICTECEKTVQEVFEIKSIHEI